MKRVTRIKVPKKPYAAKFLSEHKKRLSNISNVKNVRIPKPKHS